MDDPTAVITANLLAEARGEPVDYAAMDDACSVVVAANLVIAGVPFEQVQHMFEERSCTFRVAYNFNTNDLEIEVMWDDEE